MNAKEAKRLRKWSALVKSEPSTYNNATKHPFEIREKVRLCGVYTTHVRMGTMLVANKFDQYGRALPITLNSGCSRGVYQRFKKNLKLARLDERMGFVVS